MRNGTLVLTAIDRLKIESASLLKVLSQNNKTGKRILTVQKV
jgi:hypothetical protein